MFFDSEVLQYSSIAFLVWGSISLLYYIGIGIKLIYLKITKKCSPNMRQYGFGIIKSIKQRIEKNESNSDIFFHLFLEMFMVYALIIAIAFWMEKLIQLIF